MTVIAFPNGNILDQSFDLICFSHLRWDFVYQRPQHLMSRFAHAGRVFFVEEPVPGDGAPRLDVSEREPNLFVCVPHISPSTDAASVPGIMQHLIEVLRLEKKIDNYVAWFYTPMMLKWSHALTPRAVVYDCMDELSAFRGAPPELVEMEKELFKQADLVFTGGQSLYEVKCEQHRSVHAFPSSIDTAHFGKANEIRHSIGRGTADERPRIGFIGVIDERLDIGLLAEMATLRPDWSFVMVGPVVKISDDDLPRLDNIEYLGQRGYDELPEILAGWDAGMLPFALNESTRYISPTKTPEYLAAGLPVVSTPIRDVVRPYGGLGLVTIAGTAEEFVSGLEHEMGRDPVERRRAADDFLKDLSWDRTYSEMAGLIKDVIGAGEKGLAAAESGGK